MTADEPSGTRAVRTEASSPDATRALGTALARLLRAGDLVLLIGSLGAGKTTFAQGVAAGLGVRGDITSPTFVIARVHPTLGAGPSMVHADLYRLGGRLELDDLDLDATVADSVTVVEWGEGLAEALADDRLEVHLSRDSGTSSGATDNREIEIRAIGSRWDGIDLGSVATPGR